jgi:Flp pilus assembly protein TadG
MWQRIFHVLREKRGSMGVFTAAFLTALLLMLAFSVELWRLHTLSTGVYDAMRSGTEMAVTDNAPALYAAEADMEGSAYVYTASGWQADVDTSAVTDMLVNHLGLSQSGSDWIRYDGNGHELYRLADVNVQVSDPFAPSGDPTSAPMFTITVTYTLKTTWQSGIVLPVSVPMQVCEGIGGKF